MLKREMKSTIPKITLASIIESSELFKSTNVKIKKINANELPDKSKVLTVVLALLFMLSIMIVWIYPIFCSYQ